MPGPAQQLRRKRSISRAERLTSRQERALVTAAGAGDANATRELVDAFLPAIGAVAVAFPDGTRVERQELVQEGVAGLLSAARRYDARFKTPFWAYASFWVRKAMQELVAELARPVALSDRAVRRLARLKTARAEYVQAHGAEPTDAELRTATGLSRSQLESLQAAERTPRGIEERLAVDDPAAATVGDTVADPVAEDAYQHVLDDIEIHALHLLADRLDERERCVLFAHYGFGQPEQTLRQIGHALGLTAERARQIEAGALDKLHDALTQRAAAARPL